MKERIKTALQVRQLEEAGLVEEREVEEEVKSRSDDCVEGERETEQNERPIEVGVEVSLLTISGEQEMPE